jgi:serine/threonine protein kinase
LLLANPDKRLTATQALQHKWITSETGSDVDLLENVKEFNAKYVTGDEFVLDSSIASSSPFCPAIGLCLARY